MNRLTVEQRKAVIACLVEGNSIRATVRMTGVAKNTVVKLLVDLGTACSVHMDEAMRELPCKQIQVDEIWTFVGSKQRNVPADREGVYGDVWTWVALDPDTKLVPCYRVANRELGDAVSFMEDMAGRLASRVQLTTDGYRPYLTAVEKAFRGKVDYAQLVKLYGRNGADEKNPARRYSPGDFVKADATTISGKPDPDRISTSHVERQNLTMRMGMRRFTRLTNGFSKKQTNLFCAVSLHFAHYNFVRVHKTIGTTPAVAAGVADHPWTLEELIGLLEAAESVPTKRGPYKKTRVKRGYPATEISN